MKIQVEEKTELDCMDFAPTRCDHGKSNIFDCILCLVETMDRMKAKQEGKAGRGES